MQFIAKMCPHSTFNIKSFPKYQLYYLMTEVILSKKLPSFLISYIKGEYFSLSGILKIIYYCSKNGINDSHCPRTQIFLKVVW